MTRRAPLGLAAGLLLLTVAALSGIVHNGFVTHDDTFYLTENRRVRQGLTGESLSWALRATEGANWHPVTWVSHLLDVQMFGMNPAAHHAVGLAWHAANVLLLFVVLRAMTGAQAASALVAALFAVHPLHVESVAWASERKDLLSTFFELLAVGAWLAHLRRPGRGGYLAACGLFTLALMAKPMPVTLPFLLLLLDWWPLGRWRPGDRRALPGLLAEKAPLFLLAAASAAVTFLVQRQGGAMAFGEHIPLPARLANVGSAYLGYLFKTVWPRGLAFFYPYPISPGAGWRWIAALLAVAALTWIALLAARRRPWVGAGWFWYLGTLVPAIGFIQVGAQAMADRYTYVPVIGLFVGFAWSIADLVSRRPRLRAAAALAIGALLAGCVTLAREQTAVWRDDYSLYGQALQATSENWMAHHLLGNTEAATGNDRSAEFHYRATLAIAPGHAPSRSNLGATLARLGRLEEAAQELRLALAIDPDYAPARYNLGAALADRGDLEGAELQFREALRLQPQSPRIRASLAALVRLRGRGDEAAALLREGPAADR